MRLRLVYVLSLKTNAEPPFPSVSFLVCRGLLSGAVSVRIRLVYVLSLKTNAEPPFTYSFFPREGDNSNRRGLWYSMKPDQARKLPRPFKPQLLCSPFTAEVPH